MIDAIVTIPPYAPFIEEVAQHPLVSGLRLNTVMPIKGGRTKATLEETLKRLQERAGGKEIYLDLKCRQLRVKTFGVPPFTEIELTHALSVDTPTRAYFSDGKQFAEVVAVDGNRLIMAEGPQRVIGPGESVNIPDPSLKVDGYFTDTDLLYIEAAQSVGLHTYMLSFVEEAADLAALLKEDPQAKPVLKIESVKGLNYVAKEWKGEGRLMVGRGDLYVELLPYPHRIIPALEKIVGKDEKAILASRVLTSMSSSYIPSSQDISDVDSVVRMGYKTLMLGDDVCLKRDSVLGALNVLRAMAEGYDG